MIFNKKNFPELPNTWEKASVDFCFSQIPTSNRKVKKKDYKDNGKFPVIDQGQDLIGGYHDNKDFLIKPEKPVTVFGDHTRALKYIDFNFIPGADGTKILSPQGELHPKTMHYFLKSVLLPDKGYARHFQFLRESLLPIPPLPEQKRIADKLDCFFAKVDACKTRLDRVPEIIKRFRQSVLADAVSGNLTEDLRGENPDVENRYEVAKRNKYSKFDIPYTWVYAKLDTVINKIQAGKNFSCPAIPVTRNTVGLAKISAVTWGKFNPKETKTVVDETKIRNELFIQKNDFLISRANTIELVGASVIVDKIDFRIMISDKIWRVSFNYVDKRYVNYFIKSFRGRYEIESRSSGNQQSMRNITQKAFRNIDIPLPPLEEQKEIVKQVDKLFAIAEKIETHCQKAKVKVDKLSQSVLAKAFSGELVPQDPNDEAAEFLLNRIRSEREALAANKKKGGRTPKKLSGRGKRSKPQKGNAEVEPEPAAAVQVEAGVDKEKDRKVKLKKQQVKQIEKRFEKTEVLKAYRKAIFHQSDLDENTLLRLVGQRLGVNRLSKQIRHELESYIKPAIRRKIITRNGDGYDPATNTIHHYDEEYLVLVQRSVIRKGYEYQREHVIELAASYLGYDKVSDAFAKRMKAIFRLAIRRGLLYRNSIYVGKA